MLVPTCSFHSCRNTAFLLLLIASTKGEEGESIERCGKDVSRIDCGRGRASNADSGEEGTASIEREVNVTNSVVGPRQKVVAELIVSVCGCEHVAEWLQKVRSEREVYTVATVRLTPETLNCSTSHLKAAS